VVENRWLDHLKILTWHSSLASQKNMRNVCCQEHLRILVAHWLTQADLSLPLADRAPLPISSDPSQPDFDLDPQAAGRLVGELAVHRELFSRVWSGSPGALECILDALLDVGTEDKVQALDFQFIDPPESCQGLSLQ
jgi:hypothetical protein